MPRFPVRYIDRFMERVEFAESGCWNWTGSLLDGYAHFGVAGVCSQGHRFSYLYFVGPVEDGFQLDHLCRNRRCCNPFHVEPVTRDENTRRRVGHKYHSWKVNLQLTTEQFRAEFPNCDPETGKYL